MPLKKDLIDLLLSLAKQQQDGVGVRDDELLVKIVIMSETVTLSDGDAITGSVLNPHPVKYDEAHAIYDRCTYT